MSDTKELDKAVSLAKIELMKKDSTVFISTVCCSLGIEYSSQVAYAATNGIKILLNPETFMALKHEERAFLIAHETMHVVYGHLTRRQDRDAKLFNYAADYVINAELVDAGLTMPSVGLYDRQYDGMATEQVYKILEQNHPQEANGLDGDILEIPEDMTEAEVEAQVQEVVVRAAQLSQMKGCGQHIPGAVTRMLHELHKPVVNWRVVLRRYMQEVDKSDYSWARPNKRYHDMYLPHMKGTDLSLVSFAIDTSGSVTPEDFSCFISEVAGVFKSIKPKAIELIQFDHTLQAVEKVKSIAQLKKVKFKGNGGTEPNRAIEHYLKSKKSKVLIILTDGWFYTSQLIHTKRPVVWIVFDNPDFTAPFGKVIHISYRNTNG